MPSSSIVEVEVGQRLKLGLGVWLGLGVVEVSDQELDQHIKS